MLIKISNFGPINHFQFDLSKDLHLIYGGNAIGKSYAAYCIYLILKILKSKDSFNHRFFRHDPKKDQKIINAIIKKAEASKLRELNINTEIGKLFKEILKNELLNDLNSSFFNTFSSFNNLSNKYTEEPFLIEVFIENSAVFRFAQSTDGKIEIKEPKFNDTYGLVIKNTKTTKFTLNKNSRKKFGVRNQADFKQEFENFLYQKLSYYYNSINRIVKNVFFLPASRSGLYQALNAFTPIMTELTQNRFFIKENKIELPSLPEPLSDYFIDLSTLKSENFNEGYISILEKIETEVLKGKVHYDDDNKKIYYTPNAIPLITELSEASSMVSELAPIFLFLKHILNFKLSDSARNSFVYNYFYDDNFQPDKIKNVIFIEEPEAHLHPEVQVKLMDIFEDLAKLGVKIIMTSHSNYMFNKINNLLIKKDIPSEKVAVYHLIWTESGSIVNPEMKSDKAGIDDYNFTEVSQQLYEERLNAYNNIDE